LRLCNDSNPTERTEPSFSADVAGGTSIVDDSGTADGTKPSSAGVGSADSLYRGTIIDDGSGVTEGTKPSSPPDKDVASSGDETNSSFSDDGNRCSGTIIEDGSGTAEDTKSSSSGSLPSEDMEVA